jgi:hypothetical protein
MKVDQKISLWYPLIKGTILIEETDNTQCIPGMPFFNIVPLKMEALFMVFDRFVRPRCVEHMSLFHQPHDSSMFDMFIRADENHWCQGWNVCGIIRHFPIEI